MPAVYEKMGIRFLYPDNWTLDEQDALSGDNASVTVYSPEGAFWSIVLHPRSTDPRELTKAALDVMKKEYEDCEAEPVTETVAGQEMSGFDINFYCLDLTNTALIRGFRTPEFTFVILSQAEDREFSKVQLVFKAITASLLSGK
jgi:hypothetical protein